MAESSLGHDDKLPFLIRRLEKGDFSSVLEHLEKSFYLDEPLQVIVGTDLERTEDLDRLMIHRMENAADASVVAIDKGSGKVAGVLLIMEHSKTETPPPRPSMKSQVSETVLRFLSQLDSEYDVWKEFPHVEKYADLFILSVSREHRGQGIAYKLTMKGVQILMEEKRLPLVTCLATSPYTKRIMEKIPQFKEVWRKRVNEVKSEKEGSEPILPQAKDEDIVTLHVLEIDNL